MRHTGPYAPSRPTAHQACRKPRQAKARAALRPARSQCSPTVFAHPTTPRLSWQKDSLSHRLAIPARRESRSVEGATRDCADRTRPLQTPTCTQNLLRGLAEHTQSLREATRCPRDERHPCPCLSQGMRPPYPSQRHNPAHKIAARYARPGMRTRGGHRSHHQKRPSRAQSQPSQAKPSARWTFQNRWPPQQPVARLGSG